MTWNVHLELFAKSTLCNSIQLKYKHELFVFPNTESAKLDTQF